jgi:hypothetical protein
VNQGADRYTVGSEYYTGTIEDRGSIHTSGPNEGTTKIYGEYVSYSVTYIDVPFIKDNRAERLATITITILLSAGDRSVMIGSKDYLVFGGYQLSANIKVDLGAPLQINGLAIEHDLWSESSKGYHHDFEFEDTAYTKIERESKNSNDLLYNPILKEPQKINFIPKYTKDKSEEGYLFWFSSAETNGVENNAPMTYQYMPEKKNLKLYLAVTTSGNSITNAEVEQGIGINEASNPADKKFIPPEEPEPPSILVTIAGWISAVFLVILPLWSDFRRARKKIQELERKFEEFEEEFEEDL